VGTSEGKNQGELARPCSCG